LLDEVSSGWSSRALLDLFIKEDFSPVIDTKNQETIFKISQTGSIEAIKSRTDQSHILSVLMNLGNTQNNSNRLLEMGIKFSYPKPTSLVEFIVKLFPDRSATILKKYQTKAVENMVSQTFEDLARSARRKTILLKAPTGAGKTVVMGNFLTKVFERLPLDKEGFPSREPSLKRGNANPTQHGLRLIGIAK